MAVTFCIVFCACWRRSHRHTKETLAYIRPLPGAMILLLCFQVFFLKSIYWRMLTIYDWIFIQFSYLMWNKTAKKNSKLFWKRLINVNWLNRSCSDITSLHQVQAHTDWVNGKAARTNAGWSGLEHSSQRRCKSEHLTSVAFVHREFNDILLKAMCSEIFLLSICTVLMVKIWYEFKKKSVAWNNNL